MASHPLCQGQSKSWIKRKTHTSHAYISGVQHTQQRAGAAVVTRRSMMKSDPKQPTKLTLTAVRHATLCCGRLATSCWCCGLLGGHQERIQLLLQLLCVRLEVLHLLLVLLCVCLAPLVLTLLNRLTLELPLLDLQSQRQVVRNQVGCCLCVVTATLRINNEDTGCHSSLGRGSVGIQAKHRQSPSPAAEQLPTGVTCRLHT